MIRFVPFLALLCAISMAPARAEDSYPPLQALHELVDREAAAYRKPNILAVAQCPMSWKNTRPQDIPIKAVQSSSQWLAGNTFSLRTYRLDGGHLCGILDWPDRRLLTGAELRQFLEDQAALDAWSRVPDDRTDEPDVSEPIDLPPPAKEPTAAELAEKSRVLGIATEARAQWLLPFPKDMQQRWMLRSILDGSGAELPVPGYDVRLEFSAEGFSWHDGCNHSNVTLGKEASHTKTLLGCDDYLETDLGLVARVELDGRVLRLYEASGRSTYVFDPYPYSPMSARTWMLREIRGPSDFDLRPYMSTMQLTLAVMDDKTFSFQDADSTVYKGTLSIAAHAIERMQLGEASSAAARTAVEGQEIYRLYDEATGPYQATAPDRLIKRLNWSAITEWQLVPGEVGGTPRDLLELRAGATTYVFQ